MQVFFDMSATPFNEMHPGYSDDRHVTAHAHVQKMENSSHTTVTIGLLHSLISV